MNRRERWACIAELAESEDPEAEGRLRAWLAEKSEEIRQRKQRRPSLFLVPKPAPEPEQLELNFEDDAEVERAISAVLDKTQNRRKPEGGLMGHRRGGNDFAS